MHVSFLVQRIPEFYHSINNNADYLFLPESVWNALQYCIVASLPYKKHHSKHICETDSSHSFLTNYTLPSSEIISHDTKP
jgi:hypothetical protein